MGRKNNKNKDAVIKSFGLPRYFVPRNDEKGSCQTEFSIP
jgi:hypothetical protein